MVDTRTREGASERSQFAADAAPFDFRTMAGVAAPLAVAEPAVRASPAEPGSPGRSRQGWSDALAVALSHTRGILRLSPPPRAAIRRALQLAVAAEFDRGVAFLLVPVVLSAGALVYFSLAAEPDWLPLVAGFLFLCACALASRARRPLNMAIVGALLCVGGALLAKTETWLAGTKMLGGEITTRLSGRVVEVERMANGRVRLTIDVTATERPVLRYAPKRVRVSARRIPDGVMPGAAVAGLVSLMAPSGPVRPGSYDFSFESYFDGIGASGFFLQGPQTVAGAGPPPPLAGFRAAVERARIAIAGRIGKSIGGAEGEIAAALVVGVRAGIPEDVNEALRRAGIYHIISISGLHMALVAGTIMGLLRAGFALFPEFASRRPVKKYAAALALVGLAGYLFMSGGEVAAQRSFIMIAVMLVAVLFDRAALTMRNLAIAAIVVIAVSPHEVVGPSFQMSFAATAALVGGYAAWSDWRADRGHKPPGSAFLPGRLLRMVAYGIVGLAFTSIVAGGATAIYAAWHFQQMPTLGLFTNLAAMPIVSFIVMPFAVLGALAMPFGLDGPFFQVMGLGLSATIGIARWFAERTPTDSTGLIPGATVAVLTVALIVATVATTWLRIAAVPIAIVGLALLIGRPMPDLFVSEDGRLVGLNTAGAHMAVNRARPNAFTVQDWERAMRAPEIVGPQGKQERVAGVKQPDGAAVPGEGSAGMAQPVAANGLEEISALEPGRFACSEGLCLARHPSGAVVAHALDPQAAIDACAIADVIVIDDATAQDLCRWKDVLVVTSRDLALRGSASITFPGAPASMSRERVAQASGVEVPGIKATIQYAISQPFRPWHEQRRFSRAARGLPPYRRPTDLVSADEAKSPPTSDQPPMPARPAVEQAQ
ncbi:MAG: ComEC/Rec2 family competence protein [Hyphomicrobiales bacterium]|nr:ComEC/Rec2 family competence protein [Hyphomicrobiales bacterium]